MYYGDMLEHQSISGKFHVRTEKYFPGPILYICNQWQLEEFAQELTGNTVLTKGPPSLNKGNFWIVHKEWNSSEQKVRFRLEISIKYGYVFALPCIVTFHSFLQSSCFEPLAAGSCDILNVDTFVRPVFTFELHQILQEEVIQSSYKLFFLRLNNLLGHLNSLITTRWLN